MSRATARDDNGFTLVELLVVILILGILASVVVFALRGLGDKGGRAAVAIDERIIRTAEELHCTLLGGYATGDELVASQLLTSLPELHIVTTGDGFPEGNCPEAPAGKHHYKIECTVGTMPNCGIPGVTPPPGSDLEKTWATYLSTSGTDAWIRGEGTGSGWNRGPQMTFDGNGNVYVAGHIRGSIPTQGASQPVPSSAFVAKFSPSGALIYSTYLGNSAVPLATHGDTMVEDIVADAMGNVYIVGTNDTDVMPTTPNAYRRQSPAVLTGTPPIGAGYPVNFLTKLDPSGLPVYSSYLWQTKPRWTVAVAGDSARDVTGSGPSDISPAGVALLGPDQVLVTGLDYKYGNSLDAYRAPCGTEGDVGSGSRAFFTLMDTSKVGDASHVATTCGGDGMGIGGRAVAVTDVTAVGATAYVVGDDSSFSPKGLSKVLVAPSGPSVFNVVSSRPDLRGFAVAATSDAVYVLDHGPSTVKRIGAALASAAVDYPAPGVLLDIAAGAGGFLYEFGYGGDGTIAPVGTHTQAYAGGSGADPSDAFLLVVGPLAEVSYATYLGGPETMPNGRGNEKGSGIAVGPLDVYVGGVTTSDGFPAEGGYQSQRPTKTQGAQGPDGWDVFAARYSRRPVSPTTTTTLLPVP